MREVLFSITARPRDVLRDAPRGIVYDPGKQTHKHPNELQPFISIIKICCEIIELIREIERASKQQIFLLLIFPDKDEVAVSEFLRTDIPNQNSLHSLYIIFQNGAQFHDKLVQTESMPKLRWCRSVTDRFLQDMGIFCMAFCNESIVYYDQRMIMAEDADGGDAKYTAFATITGISTSFSTTFIPNVTTVVVSTITPNPSITAAPIPVANSTTLYTGTGTSSTIGTTTTSTTTSTLTTFTTTTSVATTLPPVQVESPSDIVKHCEQPVVIVTLASTVLVGIISTILFAVFMSKRVNSLNAVK